MNAFRKPLLVVTVLCLLCSLSAFAEKKERLRPRNRPEPALQSVKTMWRGMKAFAYHSLKSFHEGNQKVPVLGSVEVFQGMRRGTVEMATSTCRGMAGSKPKPVDEMSKANEIIESDTIVRNAADIASTSMWWPASGTAKSVAAATTIWGTQKVVDHHKEMKAELKGERDRTKDPVEQAQDTYMGRRAKTKKKDRVFGEAICLPK